jgi:hypothetical protein
MAGLYGAGLSRSEGEGGRDSLKVAQTTCAILIATLKLTPKGSCRTATKIGPIGC